MSSALRSFSASVVVGESSQLATEELFSAFLLSAAF